MRLLKTKWTETDVTMLMMMMFLGLVTLKVNMIRFMKIMVFNQKGILMRVKEMFSHRTTMYRYR